jgi:hypothetical protein
MTTMLRPVRMTGAETFWYVLGCIGFGAAYLAKVPAKKALSEAGLVQLTSAERFWYVLQCIAFGAGYLAKVPVKKALSDLAAGPGGGRAPAPVFGMPADPQPQAAPGYEPGGWPGDLPFQPFQPAQAVSSGPRYGRAGSGG